MDKLTAIRIKTSDNPSVYSDPIPIGTAAENITYQNDNLANVIDTILETMDPAITSEERLENLENAIASGLGDGVDLSLATTRTHEGLVCYPKIVFPDNMFGIMFTQYNTVDLANDKLVIILDATVPDSYRNRFILSYGSLKTDDPHELLIENDTFHDATAEPQPGKIHTTLVIPFTYSKMFIKNGADVSNMLVRCAIKLLDDKGQIERIIYSSQIHYTKAENELGFSVDHDFYTNTIDYDCYTYGAIVNDADTPFASPIIPYTGKTLLASSFIPTVSSLITSAMANSGNYGNDRSYAVIPWSLADKNHPTICICLRTGDGIYKFGGHATFIPPDMIVKSAVFSGQTFCLDDLWYKATTDLAIGDTLVLGTNCEAVDEPVIDTADLKASFDGMSAATSSDVGKSLKVKTVTDGKVTEWEFGDSFDPIVISQSVTDWLDEHIDSSSDVVIDDSLTVTGAAADAKKTGDEISELKADFTQFAGNQETLTGDYVELNYNGGTITPTVNNITGQTDIKLGVSKGNILCLPYFRPNNYTTNGLTFTINDDKSITVNGTATDDTFYNIAYYQKPLVFSRVHPLHGKQYGYFLKGCTDGSDSTYYLIERLTGTKVKTSVSAVWASSSPSAVNLCLWVKSGVTLTDKTFYPMLCLTGNEEWSSPITPYTATVESTQPTYTFDNISLNDGYNAIVTNGMNTLSVNVDGYYNLAEMQSEINDIKESVDNVWKDKKWVAFGTSITDNYSDNSYIEQGEHAGEHTGKYVPYLLDMSKLSESSFVNRGIAGGSINGHILYYIRYYTADEASADLITIEGAVNDFARSIPLGNVGDTVPYTDSLLSDSSSDGTFAGACYQAFTTAITNSPNAVVVLLTETTGKDHTGYANYSQTRKNDLNLTQWDYIDMTIKVAEFVGIPVIKCGQDSMINAQNPQYIADHIHHTYLGGYQYAKTIWSKLRSIPLKATEVPE